MSHKAARHGMRDAWVRDLLGSGIGDQAKLVMMWIALRIGEHGLIDDLPHRCLAADLHLDERRIRRAFEVATSHDLLSRTGSPSPGRTAQYEVLRLHPRRIEPGDPFATRGRFPATPRFRAFRDSIGTIKLGYAVRTFALAMSYYADSNGVVKNIRRTDWATLLDVHEQKIATRISQAKAAGLLEQIDGGTRGRVARYSLCATNEKS